MSRGPSEYDHDGQTFQDWRNYSIPDKTSTFKYLDSTEENIGQGESQTMRYEAQVIPEKMGK